MQVMQSKLINNLLVKQSFKNVTKSFNLSNLNLPYVQKVNLSFNLSLC